MKKKAFAIAAALAMSTPAASAQPAAGAQTTSAAQEQRSNDRGFPWDLLGLLGLAGLLGLRRNNDDRTHTTRH